MIVGARVEGSRPVVTASERYGDELLCSSNYAEQSAVPFPGATSRDTCGEHYTTHTHIHDMTWHGMAWHGMATLV